MIEHGSVEGVIQSGLCTSCGTCVAICPKGAVGIEETPSGLLFARINPELCDMCGLCLRGCSHSCQKPSLLPSGPDPFKGKVLAAFCGHAIDSKTRTLGQSGGVVTALLSYLLESGHISKALVTRMPEDGSLRPQPIIANCKDELLGTHGSNYCPVPLNASIPTDIAHNGKKMAVVGLPCHVHGLRNAQQVHTNLKDGIGLTIGLFCDRTLAFSAINYLVGKGKVSIRDVAAFRYRDKSQGGWPGTVYIRTKKNKEIRVSSHERLAIKDFFTPLCCRLCFDKLNLLSDIAVGDAWGVRESEKGFSVILARTQRGLKLLKEAEKANILCLKEISCDSVFTGQGIEERRLRWNSYSTIWRAMEKGVTSFEQICKVLETPKYKNLKKHYYDIQLSLQLNANIEVRKIMWNCKRNQFFLKLKRSLKCVIKSFYGSNYSDGS